MTQQQQQQQRRRRWRARVLLVVALAAAWSAGELLWCREWQRHDWAARHSARRRWARVTRVLRQQPTAGTAHAQAPGPIGAPTACSAGKTYRVTCFIGPGGYLADVRYRNSLRTTDVSLCNAPQQQLARAARPLVLEISAADAFVRVKACQDSYGVRGLLFVTQLGAQLSCGALEGHCVPFSSRSVYPLRGLLAACDTPGGDRPGYGAAAAAPQQQPYAAYQQPHPTDGGGHWGAAARGEQRWHPMLTRVLTINSACWVPQEQPLSTGGAWRLLARGSVCVCLCVCVCVCARAKTPWAHQPQKTTHQGQVHARSC
jgi:hypothetical protein